MKNLFLLWVIRVSVLGTAISCMSLILLYPDEVMAGTGAGVDPSAKLYQSECGSCHLAFPPKLLVQSDWLKITSNLRKHFDTDASVDAKTLLILDRYLTQNASSRLKHQLPTHSLRITESTWFVRKHRKERLPRANGPVSTKVRAWSDCSQCHSRAEEGVFDDDD